MTIGGAIKDIESFEIPFYQESSREKVIETIISTYYQGVTDAIDEFSEKLIKTLSPIEEGERMELEAVICDIKLIAERLKENKNDSQI